MNGRVLLLSINILFNVREQKAMKSQKLFVLVFIAVPSLFLRKVLFLFLPSHFQTYTPLINRQHSTSVLTLPPLFLYVLR